MKRGCCSSPRLPVALSHPACLPNALVPSSGGQGTVPDTRATRPVSQTLAKYLLFKISPSRLAPNLKVFLSSVGVMCRCQHVCVTSCWWSALLAVDKLMMCSRPFFFFNILLNRRKAENMGTYIVCLICLTLLTGFFSTSGFDVNVEAKTGLRPGHRSGLAAVILRPTSRG